jgi:thiosulfate dehydrogenase [quinone] large subunit
MVNGGQGGPRSAQIAYALFRITLGLDMFMHGVMRIPTLGAWVNTTAKLFETSFLPMSWVRAFLYFLPFPEGLIGLCLILGLWTRLALFGGALTIFILVFGTGTRQDWTTVGLQMIYALYYYIMMVRVDDNWLALDARS